MLRPLLLAILLCFPGVPVSTSLFAWNAPEPVILNDLTINAYLNFYKNTPLPVTPGTTPIVSNSVPDQTHSLAAGSFSIDLSEVFSDTDGQTLNFSAVSNKTEIATASVEGHIMTVTLESLGTCRIRSTARDDNNGKADDTFTLTISNNQPPTLAPESNLSNQVLFTGGTPLILNLSTIFLDPDGDPLVYTAEAGEDDIVRISVEQDILTISPNLVGETLISLTANDQNGGMLLESFAVEVRSGYPSTLTSDVHVTFDDYRDQGNYRMIALPGNQSVPLSNTISGEVNKDWVAYAPDTTNSGLLIPYDRSSNFVLTPGRGLWFLSKTDWVQSQKTVPTVSLGDQGAFEIPLHSGWNIISNPLDKDISWSDIAQQNNVSQGVWRWNHGYQRIDTLYSTAHIQEAYYFNNIEERRTLKLPYFPSAIPSKKISTALHMADGNAAANTAVLEVSGQLSNKSSRVSFIWTPDASTGFDPMDQLAPPAHFNALALSLTPAHPDFNAQPLAVEARPSAARVHRFDLELKANEEDYAVFRLDGLENLLAEHILLVNQLDTKSYTLEDMHIRQIPLQAGVTPFSLFLGERDEIEQALEDLTPSIFSLGQNYPNPFTPLTTIEYSMPTAQYINLSVYDLMGRLIITLHRGEKEAGLHRVQWNGRDRNQNSVANGVYFYRLQAGSWTQSHKMTLIR